MKRLEGVIEQAVETILCGMGEVRKNLVGRIEDGRVELDAMDAKWSEYREDIKNKHEFHVRQQEFMDRAEEMVRRAIEGWVMDTQKGMDREIWKMRNTEVKIIEAMTQMDEDIKVMYNLTTAMFDQDNQMINGTGDVPSIMLKMQGEARKVLEEGKNLLNFSRNLLVAILGESKEGGGVVWQVVTRLRRLNIGGLFAVAMNHGGDGETWENESRDQLNNLKEVVNRSFQQAQREHKFWTELIETQEERMDRQVRRIIEENPGQEQPNVNPGARMEDAGPSTLQREERNE